MMPARQATSTSEETLGQGHGEHLKSKILNRTRESDRP